MNYEKLYHQLANEVLPIRAAMQEARDCILALQSTEARLILERALEPTPPALPRSLIMELENIRDKCEQYKDAPLLSEPEQHAVLRYIHRSARNALETTGEHRGAVSVRRRDYEYLERMEEVVEFLRDELDRAGFPEDEEHSFEDQLQALLANNRHLFEGAGEVAMGFFDAAIADALEPSPAPTELELLEREHDAALRVDAGTTSSDVEWLRWCAAHAAVEAAKNKTTTNQED